MDDIYFATTNNGKFESLCKALENTGIRAIQKKVDLPEIQSTNLRLIAEGKLWAAYNKIERPTVVQDSGFFMPSWGDFPGPFTKFALESMGIAGLLTLAAARSPACEFRECLAFYAPGMKEPRYFEAVIRGQLTDPPRGEAPRNIAWSDLWLVFVPEDQTKTIGEMTEAEREQWRRVRGDTSAVKFAKWMRSQITGSYT